MNADKVVDQITEYSNNLYAYNEKDKQLEPALPEDLANNLLLIRGLALRLIDIVAECELDYRKAKAKRFDELIRGDEANNIPPMKKSPAFDQLEMEPDLIDKKITTERLRNYLKYTEGLCTSVQSVLKYKTGTNA